MGQVVEFVKPKPAAAAAATKSPHYFCQKCSSETFRLYADHSIDCAGCGVLMGNIQVGEKP